MNNFVLREFGENESFDPLTIYSNVPFTQAKFYGNWQKSLGREVKRYIILCDNKPIAYFQIIKYPLFRDKSYFYIPYGPIIGKFSTETLLFLKIELKKIARKSNVIFIRLDFTPPNHNKEIFCKIFTSALVCTYHSAYFQPRVEWFLKLDKSEDELLMNMNENARYSVRLAKRKEIKIEIVTSGFEQYFQPFYELMLSTSIRNGFSLHDKEYYKNIFKDLKSENAYLSIASLGEKILVIDLIIQYGQIANYVFGGSSNEHRNFAPTYLAIWTAICQAKRNGNSYFNFGGISTGKIYKGWDGLTAHKKKFGGFEVVHSNFFDIVVRHSWYYLYNAIKVFKKIVKF